MKQHVPDLHHHQYGVDSVKSQDGEDSVTISRIVLKINKLSINNTVTAMK